MALGEVERRNLPRRSFGRFQIAVVELREEKILELVGEDRRVAFAVQVLDQWANDALDAAPVGKIAVAADRTALVLDPSFLTRCAMRRGANVKLGRLGEGRFVVQPVRCRSKGLGRALVVADDLGVARQQHFDARIAGALARQSFDDALVQNAPLKRDDRSIKCLANGSLPEREPARSAAFLFEQSQVAGVLQRVGHLGARLMRDLCQPIAAERIADRTASRDYLEVVLRQTRPGEGDRRTGALRNQRSLGIGLQRGTGQLDAVTRIALCGRN